MIRGTMNKLTAALWALAVSVCMLCLFAGTVLSQNLTGTLNGFVKDSTGAVLPGATVKIGDTATGVVERTMKTDAGGRYEAPALLAGTYRVSVQASGFQTSVVAPVVLHVDQTLRVDVALEIGTVTNEVAVSAATTGVDLEDSAQTTLINPKEVTELPLNQRNFLQFLSLQPGINGGIGTISRGPLGVNGGNNDVSVSVNGSAHATNGYYLDGADIINHDAHTMLGLYPSVDSIAEQNLLRNNYGAQYGGVGAAITNLVSKSGTSAFHGSAYFFFRNQLLNANGYFNNQNGIDRVPIRYNDSGFTLGGPLFIPKYGERTKSNTFFFVSMELLRSAQAGTSSTAQVPTALQRQGIFSTPVCVAYNAAGKCTSTSTTVTNIDPAARAFLTDVINKTPLPNSTDPTNPQQLYASYSGVMNESQILARLDHSFGEKLRFFARFMNDPYNSLAPVGVGSNTQSIPGLATTTAQSGAQNILAHLTYIPTQTWVIETGVSHYRGYENTTLIGPLNPVNAPDFNPVLPYVNQTGKIPGVTINATKYNSPGPIKRINPNSQAFVNVTHSMGRHTILFGINAERETSSFWNLNNGNNGTFTFKAPASTGNAQAIWNQSWADFLIGYATGFTQSSFQQLGQGYGTSILEAYVQDNFKVTENLVLNAGVRYSYFRNPTEWILSSNNFDPELFQSSKAPTISSTGYICLAASCPGGGAVPNPNYDPLNGIITPGQNSPFGRKLTSQPNLDFAPRFGFAWSPTLDRKAAIRGGVGIYYRWPSIWDNSPTGNPPAAVTMSGTNVSFDNPTGTVGAQTTPPSLNGLGVNYKVGFSTNYTLDLQHQLPRNVLLDVAYVGNVGRHLPIGLDLNQPQPGAYVTAGIAAAGGITSSNTPALNRLRPYQGYGAMSVQMPIGTSNYNALQVQVKEHLRSGLDIGASYTWSKELQIAGAQNVYDLSADYGPMDQKNQMFSAHFVYDLPFYRQQKGFTGHLLGGYELSGIVNLLSGTALTVSTNNNDPAGIGTLASGGAGSARPDQIGDPNTGPRTIAQWFNTSAFAFVPASQARPGSAPVGSVYGPGTKMFTFGLMRNIRIAEGMRLQIRAEAYNAFNLTNLNNPNTTLNSANFGKITGNGMPRNMQLAAKFTF